MLAGVSSSCLYPMETDKALIELGKQGIKNAEIYLCTYSEFSYEYLKKLKSIKDHYGITVTSVHPFTSAFESLMFFSAYKNRFEDCIELYKHFAKAATFLDADIVVFHGNIKMLPVEDNFYFERYGKLNEKMAECGVQLCQENVSRCQSCDPKFILKMRENIENVGFVLDIKQAVRGGVSPYAMLEAMGKNLQHIHISDNDSKHFCLPIGEGNFNVESFLQKARVFNSEAYVILELYRENFQKISKLGESYNILSDILM